jgi:putative heme-binding domain-containing protein
MRRRLFVGLVILLSVPSRLSADNAALGLKVPPGFEVTEYADSTLANDIFSMTLDPRGRVVVSGRGYIRILVDDRHAGRANRAIDFADGLKEGAQGMLWEGSWLYFTADGGLRRYPVAKDGDRAAGPSELVRAMKTGGEHASHAIKRGPDGWLYVLGGNNSGIDRRYAQLATSPIREPIAGCVLRFTPDLKESEIVADGFRNPYDMDFNPDGELFTFDSDNERCVSLPWYESTRFYHVIPGGHYGWLAPQWTETWRRPPYFADIVAPVKAMGRGSPTGVVCYRHVQFPEAYHGGMFLLDWTFGKVYFLKLERSGSTYTCRKEMFLESVGDNGFAPTAAVVHPRTGDLFICIGGRGTRGAVYRIRYPERAGKVDAAGLATLRVLPRSLAWSPELGAELMRDATGDDASRRLHALLSLRRHHDHCDANLLREAILANWAHPDRYVRMAAAELVGAMPEKDREALAREARTSQEAATVGLGTYRTRTVQILEQASRSLVAKREPAELRLTWVRLIQLALGDLSAPKLKGTVWEGYSLRRPPQPAPAVQAATAALRRAFPSGHTDLDREISRTLAALEDDEPAILRKVADHLTPTSDPVEDIHYLIVLARLRGPRCPELTHRVARAMLALDRKLHERHANRDRNWPLRIAEMQAESARKDPSLNHALLTDAEFGRPDHALFTKCPGFDRRRAAEVFLARARKEGDEFGWTPTLVDLIGSLPAEQAVPVLRQLWGKAGLDEAILPVLARQPQPGDREKFLEGLNSPKLATVRRCLAALENLPPPTEGPALVAVVRCLRSLPEDRETGPLREKVARYLQHITGEVIGADKEAWTRWFGRRYPALAARLENVDGVDVAGWRRRLEGVDWSAGVAERGRPVFVKASCVSCHSGAQALGPDLRGAAGRFSRADLFTAIIQPSMDISPRYRTTLMATAAGKVYQGLVIYEAVDGLLLQTGPATTVRIPGDQIAARRYTSTSLMPAGLIDKLTDQEIADLYAYLKGLK